MAIRHYLSSARVVLLPLGLLATPVRAQSNLNPAPTLRLPARPATGLSIENRAFIDQASGGATAIIEAGRLATQNARGDSVRRLAQDIAADQQTIKDELTRLAGAKGYAPSGGMPADLAKLQQLTTGGDADFDQRYLKAQDQASRWLFALYQTEMASTQDVDFRTFAATRTLILRKHLEAIQRAADQTGLRLEAPKNPPQY